MPLAHPAIAATSSPARCSFSPRTKLKYRTHTHANAHPPPRLQSDLLALEPTSTILPTQLPLSHPPPNQKTCSTSLGKNSTTLRTPMPLTHLPHQRQPAFLAL